MTQNQSAQDVLETALKDLDSGQLSKAERKADRVLKKFPQKTDAMQIKALVHRARGETERAIAILEAGLAIRPDAIGLTTLYASVLGEAGQYETALNLLQSLQTRISKDIAGVSYNTSLMLLNLGRFADALPLFEARLVGPSFQHTVVDGLPRWTGQDLSDGHLLLTGEQGLGDQVLFAALLDHVKPLAKRVTLTANPRLVPLFQRSFPDLECVPHSESGPDFSQMNGEPDCYSPVGSLAGVLAPELLAERRHHPYLVPDEDAVARLRHTYKSLAGKHRVVGISWTSPRAALSMAKSMPAGVFGSLFKGQDVLLVNLQYRGTKEDLAAISRVSGAPVHQDPEIDLERDIDAVTAQCLAVDHVVTVSTSLAHLAGAAGAATSVLLPKGVGSMWYWSDHEGLQPWYQTVEAERQTVSGDWGTVANSMRRRLPQILELGAS